MNPSPFASLQASFRHELFNNILPYWLRIQTPRSFIPALDNENQPISGTPLGLIMVSRLLWTYSRAYALYSDPEHLKLANHAKTVLQRDFLDKENGGFFWSVDPETGTPVEPKKQCYGQAFCVYAFSEHYRASQEKDSLQLAFDTFHLIREKAWHQTSGGYLETFEADWTPLEKMRLGAEDLDAPKTMNNHLHLIEAFANLHLIHPSDETKDACIQVLRTIADRIILPDQARFGLFYDMDWNLIDPVISPGHDIEGSWLLWEAAEIVGDAQLEKEMRDLALGMAERVLQTGIDTEDHGVFDEFHPGENESETKCWWPQAEGVMGFFNAYQLSGDKKYLDAAIRIWELIQAKFIDTQNGEWLWGLHSDGRPMNKEKAGPWKSSYHNGRACMEMISRLNQAR